MLGFRKFLEAKEIKNGIYTVWTNNRIYWNWERFKTPKEAEERLNFLWKNNPYLTHASVQEYFHGIPSQKKYPFYNLGNDIINSTTTATSTKMGETMPFYNIPAEEDPESIF